MGSYYTSRGLWIDRKLKVTVQCDHGLPPESNIQPDLLRETDYSKYVECINMYRKGRT